MEFSNNPAYEPDDPTSSSPPSITPFMSNLRSYPVSVEDSYPIFGGTSSVEASPVISSSLPIAARQAPLESSAMPTFNVQLQLQVLQSVFPQLSREQLVTFLPQQSGKAPISSSSHLDLLSTSQRSSHPVYRENSRATLAQSPRESPRAQVPLQF